MAMKLFSFNDQLVANLRANEQKNDLFVCDIHIVEHAELPSAELELSESIRAQPANGLGFVGRLLSQPDGNSGLHDSPIAD